MCEQRDGLALCVQSSGLRWVGREEVEELLAEVRAELEVGVYWGEQEGEEGEGTTADG